jgi:LPXTG-motif cell wall-anchored protein
MRFLLVIIGLICILPPEAEAKLFKNAYVSFQLPSRWNCHLEKTEWICRSSHAKDKREAIIILTAKEVGPQDSLPIYTNYLKQPKTVPGRGGKPTRSKIKHTKQRRIAGHQWVDGLQLGSEIPSFYTRYLATVKGRIAILVTFSAHRRYYTKYSADFFRAIQSLRVVATNDLFKNPNAGIRGAGESLGGAIGGVIPQDLLSGEEEYPDELSDGSGDDETMMILGFVIIALGLYFMLKRRKKS